MLGNSTEPALAPSSTCSIQPPSSNGSFRTLLVQDNRQNGITRRTADHNVKATKENKGYMRLAYGSML